MAELTTAQTLEDAKSKRRAGDTELGDDSETEAETVIDTGDIDSGSKEVEVLERKGELKARGSPARSKSELSTEDEWERVSENEKDK